MNHNVSDHLRSKLNSKPGMSRYVMQSKNDPKAKEQGKGQGFNFTPSYVVKKECSKDNQASLLEAQK